MLILISMLTSCLSSEQVVLVDKSHDHIPSITSNYKLFDRENDTESITLPEGLEAMFDRVFGLNGHSSTYHQELATYIPSWVIYSRRDFSVKDLQKVMRLHQKIRHGRRSMAQRRRGGACSHLRAHHTSEDEQVTKLQLDVPFYFYGLVFENKSLSDRVARYIIGE